MGRRLSILAAVLGLLLGAGTGIALAGGHTRGSIYHGPYFEAQGGDDYHHSWTEHGHSGYKWASFHNDYITLCYEDDWDLHHVHCTYYYEGYQGTYHKTAPDAIQCGGDISWQTYGDNHGICDHEMREP